MRTQFVPLAICTLAATLSCDGSQAPSVLSAEGEGAESVRGVTAVPSFDRTALLIDDFGRPGIDDCEHDALVQPIVRHAVEPFLEIGEEVDIFNTHVNVGCGEMAAATPPELSLLLQYKTVFWNVSPISGQSGIAQTVTGPDAWPGEESDVLRSYVRSGGNLVVWGVATIAELLGGFYPSGPLQPDLPAFVEPTYGKGTFVWDMMRLRVEFDRTGRGGVPALDRACSGLVGLERAASAPAMLPAGVLDPTGFSTRSAIWIADWHGADNPSGIVVTALTGRPALQDRRISAWYAVIPNAFSYESSVGPCGSPFGSPLDAQPVVLAIAPAARRGGKIIWMGSALYPYAEIHAEHLKQLMRGFAEWVYE